MHREFDLSKKNEKPLPDIIIGAVSNKTKKTNN